MTIDEAIAKHRKIAKTQKALYDACTLKERNKHFLREAEEHEQLAEWLEDYRRLLEFEKSVLANEDGYLATMCERIGYNKAIDDLLGGMNQITYNCQDADELFEKICDLAEQLKVGGGEYNDGWIPCSERLPEESGYYLVTYHDWSDGNFLPKYDDTYVRRLHYQISEHFVGWNYPKNVDDRAENDCHKEVIAWQPLPEPFKERD